MGPQKGITRSPQRESVTIDAALTRKKSDRARKGTEKAMEFTQNKATRTNSDAGRKSNVIRDAKPNLKASFFVCPRVSILDSLARVVW